MKELSRLTPATLDVLQALLETTEPTWGLAIVKTTGRPAGSIYPILERLERLEWAHSEWETDPTRSGPRRRLYRLSPEGAVAAAAAIERARTASTRVGRTPGTAVSSEATA